MNLNQVTVPVLNIEKSIQFYSLLELKLIVKSHDYARFVCPDGNSTFSIHKVDELPVGEGIWVYFEVENLENYIASLKEKGIVLDTEPEMKSWLWKESRLKDPDNNILIIYFAGENRKFPPWRI